LLKNKNEAAMISNRKLSTERIMNYSDNIYVI